MGIMGSVTSIPAGFEVSFIVAACNEGRERSSSALGRSAAPTSFQDQRDVREADRTMILGYSIDNGAYCYCRSIHRTETVEVSLRENFETTQIRAAVECAASKSCAFFLVI